MKNLEKIIRIVIGDKLSEDDIKRLLLGVSVIDVAGSGRAIGFNEVGIACIDNKTGEVIDINRFLGRAMTPVLAYASGVKKDLNEVLQSIIEVYEGKAAASEDRILIAKNNFAENYMAPKARGAVKSGAAAKPDFNNKLVKEKFVEILDCLDSSPLQFDIPLRDIFQINYEKGKVYLALNTEKYFNILDIRRDEKVVMEVFLGEFTKFIKDCFISLAHEVNKVGLDRLTAIAAAAHGEDSDDEAVRIFKKTNDSFKEKLQEFYRLKAPIFKRQNEEFGCNGYTLLHAMGTLSGEDDIGILSFVGGNKTHAANNLAYAGLLKNLNSIVLEKIAAKMIMRQVKVASTTTVTHIRNELAKVCENDDEINNAIVNAVTVLLDHHSVNDTFEREAIIEVTKVFGVEPIMVDLLRKRGGEYVYSVFNSMYNHVVNNGVFDADLAAKDLAGFIRVTGISLDSIRKEFAAKIAHDFKVGTLRLKSNLWGDFFSCAKNIGILDRDAVVGFIKSDGGFVPRNLVDIEAVTYLMGAFNSGESIFDRNQKKDFQEMLAEVGENFLTYATNHLNEIVTKVTEGVVEQDIRGCLFFDISNLNPKVDPATAGSMDVAQLLKNAIATVYSAKENKDIFEAESSMRAIANSEDLVMKAKAEFAATYAFVNDSNCFKKILNYVDGSARDADLESMMAKVTVAGDFYNATGMHVRDHVKKCLREKSVNKKLLDNIEHLGFDARNFLFDEIKNLLDDRSVALDFKYIGELKKFCVPAMLSEINPRFDARGADNGRLKGIANRFGLSEAAFDAELLVLKDGKLRATDDETLVSCACDGGSMMLSRKEIAETFVKVVKISGDSFAIPAKAQAAFREELSKTMRRHQSAAAAGGAAARSDVDRAESIRRKKEKDDARKARRAEEAAARDDREATIKTKAATKIQSTVRGHKVREDIKREKINKAATKLQAVIKGYNIRKKLSTFEGLAAAYGESSLPTAAPKPKDGKVVSDEVALGMVKK